MPVLTFEEASTLGFAFLGLSILTWGLGMIVRVILNKF